MTTPLTTAQPTQGEPAFRADSSPDLPIAEARRPIIRFAVLGIAAYALAMVATMPASVVLKNRPWRTGVAGTIWNGEVGVAGGSAVEWRWAPLRSLTSLGFAVDWRATGPDTDLGGRALLRPGRIVLDKVSGAADATFLQAVAPGLPFTCELTMQVEIDRLALGRADHVAEGEIATDPGTCAPKQGGAAAILPALILTGEHIGTESRIRLAPMGQRRRTLVAATLAQEGGARITLTREGAELLPFTGLPPGTTIEL